MKEKMLRQCFYKEESGMKYFFIDVGSERHGKVSHRIWISNRFVKYDNEKQIYYVEFPIINSKLVITEKGNKVIKQGENTIYDVYIECGYRGESNIEVDGVNKLVYFEFKSPIGSLGKSMGVIVEISEDVIVKWSRTGRLYGRPDSGKFLLKKDGGIYEIVEEDIKKVLED